jgi:OOP family OmpA-OmpF porin
MNMRYFIPCGAFALAIASSAAALAQSAPGDRTESFHFAPNSSTLTRVAKIILDDVATDAKSHEYKAISVEANSDAASARAALRLSRRMANGVAAYLVTKGVDRKRIRVKAWGSAKPVVPDAKSPEDKLRNRYVNVTVKWK